MRTPLYDEHAKMGARIIDFAGWEMPLSYTGIVDEVLTVRKHAGIFDLSHMGELLVTGSDSMDLLQYLLTNDISGMAVGKAQYNLLCNDTGGVLDDLIVYRLGEDRYLIITNAINTLQDLSWIQKNNRFAANIQDQSTETALIAVQGPDSAAILRQITSLDIGSMKRFHIEKAVVGDVDAWIASTGYTGGPGFEILCDSGYAQTLWRTLIDVGQALGAKPVGLGARDVLRIEAGYPLYGHELSDSISPANARLMWAVKLEKDDFVGKKPILQAVQDKPRELLTGLETIERCIPREGYDVATDNGEIIGRVTSGTYSPTLDKGIAMAYVRAQLSEVGMKMSVLIRGKPCGCQVVKLPFYHPD